MSEPTKKDAINPDLLEIELDSAGTSEGLAALLISTAEFISSASKVGRAGKWFHISLRIKEIEKP